MGDGIENLNCTILKAPAGYYGFKTFVDGKGYGSNHRMT